MFLEISHITKTYPDLPVLHDVSLAVAEGEIVSLLGPSGCGKTTLLRIIAGLEAADQGQVRLGGHDLAGVPVHRRNFGLMFQDYALFPHRDVAANVAFGLRMQGRPRAEIAGRVGEMLALVGLAGYERRDVTELSGGEQQRVALARSLAPRPRLLMLDEPLGALDRALREQLMIDLRAILKRVVVTTIYVTHDQEEAFAIADRVVILRARPEAGQGGHVEQIGAPQEVYRRPASAYVAAFLGFKNLLTGVVSATAPALTVQTALGELAVSAAGQSVATGARVVLLIRPEAASALPAGAAAPNVITGRLLERSFRGSYYLIRTEHRGGVALTCEITGADTDLPAPGQPITLALDPGALTLLPAA
jgi:ABC-type Fe3+/spermidine/putrescine transport system ATPase subunit